MSGNTKKLDENNEFSDHQAFTQSRIIQIKDNKLSPANISSKLSNDDDNDFDDSIQIKAPKILMGNLDSSILASSPLKSVPEE